VKRLLDRLGPEGLAAKWRAMLFIVGTVLLFTLALEPLHWLVLRGWMQGFSPSWTGAAQWAGFIATLLATLTAAWMERRPASSYGLPLSSAFRARFWEGALWGLGMATMRVFLLWTCGALSLGRVPLRSEDVALWAVWGVGMLGLGLFEQCLTRGYLQVAVGRRIGFWQAAALLSLLASLENLLSPSYRNAVAFTSSLLYGLLFCLTLRRTGNLWFAVGVHTFLSWGTILSGLGLPPLAGAHSEGALLQPVLNGPAWLNGGEYGPEASVVTPLLIAATAVGVHYRFRLSPNPSQRGPF
jgi:membrane protease YdiL (CAAX protease family)